MDDDVFEKAKEEDLSLDEAEELQALVEETGLSMDDVEELRREL